MKILNYAVIYKGFIITHNSYKRARIVYDTESFIELDSIYNIVLIHINPDEELIENNNLFKVEDEAELLPEGEYELYPLIYLNGIPFVTSKLIYENMVSIIYMSETYINKDMIKKITNPKKNKHGDDHYLFLLRGGYLPQQDLETGSVTQSYTDDELTSFFRATNLLYPVETITVKANFWLHYFNKFANKHFISHDATVYTGTSESVYLSGSHYADLVIQTLKQAYPEVHFFNTPSDWGKDKSWKKIKNNQKDYNEFVRYNVGAEDYSRARRDIYTSFGPVIFNVMVPIDFEYATSDTDTFVKRRTDFFVDQFISYYTHDHFKLDSDLIGDNSKITGFAINWVKDEMYSVDMTNKDSNIVDMYNMGLHSMRFRAELFVRIIRFHFEAPPILKIIAEIIKDETSGKPYVTKVTEANEEEKELINKYYAEGKYLKEGELLELKESGVDLAEVEVEVESGENVEIINSNYIKPD